eukprot:TRINITY_DN4181_c0_g2_i1.p1 TRINITY_DN4181_c0_g2~~TRINITY_DN4181_c0_g2_i1.p1  ORF type:complete len:387 (-),score=113.12 TRINITY_DN4181_c0_g2_i1:73-1233(-)
MSIAAFEFATANRIVFAHGAISQVPGIASSMGSKALIVTGRNIDRAKPLTDALKIPFICYGVGEEPTVEIATEGLIKAKDFGCDLVIAFGGGSVIDTAKAIAAVFTNGGEFMDYMEVIGRGKTLSKPSLPFIAIPTTSGTGAEVTRNAVLCSKQHNQKVSLRSPYMLPNVAVIDPKLTISVPPHVTAATGLDALTQCLEVFTSNKSNPITDAIAKEGMARGAKSLKKCFDSGEDLDARSDMCICSLSGGLALANAKLGAVHGFAGVIGGMFPGASHGAVCAALLPHVIDVNVKALTSRDPESVYLKRYDEVAQILTGNFHARSTDGSEWISKLCFQLEIKSLREYGLTDAHVDDVVQKASGSSSMQGNPIKLTIDELTDVLKRAMS